MADLRPWLFPEWFRDGDDFDYERLARDVQKCAEQLKVLRQRAYNDAPPVGDREEFEFIDDALGACGEALALWEEWKHFDPDHAFNALDIAKEDAGLVLRTSPYRNSEHPTTEQENATP